MVEWWVGCKVDHLIGLFRNRWVGGLMGQTCSRQTHCRWYNGWMLDRERCRRLLFGGDWFLFVVVDRGPLS